MDTPTYEELLKQVKTNFEVFGIPFDKPKIEIRFFVLLICVIIMFIAELAFLLLKTSEDLLVLTKLIPCSCIGLLSVLKLLPVAFKMQKVFKLSESLDVLYTDMINHERKRNFVHNKVKYVPFVAKYYYILNMVLATVYSFSTLVIICYEYWANNKVVYLLPFAIILPFSTDSCLTWLPVYVYSALCGKKTKYSVYLSLAFTNEESSKVGKYVPILMKMEFDTILMEYNFFCLFFFNSKSHATF